MEETRHRQSTLLRAVALGAAVALLSGVVLADERLEDRRAQIESMSPDELAVLRRQWDRFRALPARERDRLRQLHRDLEADPHGKELHAVLVRYQKWLKRLSPGQRAELMSLAPKERIREIKRLQSQQRRQDQRARRFRTEMEWWASNQPSPGDIDVIWSWLEAFTAANQERILSSVPERQRAYLAELDGPLRQINLVRIALQRPHGREPRQTSLVTAADLRSLAARLSPEAQKKLARITQPGRRRAKLRQWIHSAVFTHMRRQDSPHGQFPISQQELERFFEYYLTPDKQASLLDMPREEMQRELRWLYIQGPSAQHASGAARGASGAARGASGAARGALPGGRDRRPRDWGGPPFQHGDRPRRPRGRGRPPRRAHPADLGPPGGPGVSVHSILGHRQLVSHRRRDMDGLCLA